MAYRPNLGFVPEPLENLIERLRVSAQEKLGMHSNSQEEFMGSNLWLIYYAVALMKNQTDLLMEEVLDKTFDYFYQAYGSLEQKEGTSSQGLQKILQSSALGFETQTFQNNPELQTGELRVCLLEPDLQSLQKKLTHYFDFTMDTYVGSPLPTEKILCDVGLQAPFYYTIAYATPLYLAISYGFISGYVVTGKEKELIQELFIKKWQDFQILGRDFLPDAYLGNSQELPFLASLSVGYKINPEDSYLFEPRTHNFGEYFTIQKSEDGEPLIELIERKG